MLPNGKVLAAGGQGSGSVPLSVAELYDPATGLWTATGSLITARQSFAATLLPKGKVLAAGGNFNSGALASAELYDPATGIWSITGSLATARSAGAVLLPNGNVLIVGGSATGGPSLATAERYDTATGTWAATGSLVTARGNQTPVLLPTMKVLAAGGYNGSALASAELYDVGLGFSAAWQPQITSASLNPAGKLVLAGIGFTGISGVSGGNTQDSSTNYPVVQLRWLDNEQSNFLSPDPSARFSATSFTSLSGVALRPGTALVTVFANGIPSVSAIVSFGGPGITTGSASPVSFSTAILNGTVTSNGTATNVAFQYSASPTLASGVTTTALQTFAGTVSNVAASQPITGLAGHTAYYFRASATNNAGTTLGPIASFTTLNTAPTAPDGAATGTTGNQKTVIVTFPATDADGDAVTITAATGSANLTVNSVTATTVTFTPSAGFTGNATFTYTLSDGHGGTATGTTTVAVTTFSIVESWRSANFGTTANTGNTADNADFDGDGIANLIEFASGTNPAIPAAGPLQYAGTFAGGGTIITTGQPSVRIEGNDIRALFVRRSDYLAAGLTYTVRFSADLTTWSPGTVVPVILADDGTYQIVSVPYPAMMGGGFFRVSVSRAPGN